jgi:hypothetical protein
MFPGSIDDIPKEKTTVWTPPAIALLVPGVVAILLAAPLFTFCTSDTGGKRTMQ